ncbi:MAG TPA: response regulator, partial [Burkholderiales bacterium]|nr:response regulator [Burkholderiales bacterium]
NEIVLIVEDTGQGIEPAFLPHAFEMFRQADVNPSRSQSGMGIGLALVQQLVELHGGSITAHSGGANQGARFTVRLPASREALLPAAPVTEMRRDALRGMKVLVVDDSADTTDMLRRLLELEGASVVTAGSGWDALQIASGRKFDVVVSDISMPGMDGFEFLHRLRGLPGGTEVPVLALTGFGRVEDSKRAQREGFFSHLTKPLDVNAVVETLRGMPVRTSRPEMQVSNA